MTYERVWVSVDESGVGWLEFNHPPINAFDWTMLSETPAALADLLARPQVRVIVVASALEKWFTAGADMHVLEAMDGAGMRRWIETSQTLARALRDADRPLLAAIHGTAVGGGLEIAALCDVRFAADDARVGQPEIGIAFFPPIAATRSLPRLIGRGAALRLLYEGRILGAAEAAELGLIDAIVPPDRLRDHVGDYARQLAAKPRRALAAIRRLVTLGDSISFEEFLRLEADEAVRIADSADFREGVTAFLAKRPPRWSTTL